MNIKFKVQRFRPDFISAAVMGRLKGNLLFKTNLNRSDVKLNGFTLLELVITLTVLSILVMGTIPLMQNANKRQKEFRLRENLRIIRNAIDEFHRDTIGACPLGAIRTGNPAQDTGGAVNADPRSRVVIDDCSIFNAENLDRFPPTIETLVEGVKVKARGLPPGATSSGKVFDGKNATELTENKEITKVYLRELPIDPMTEKSDWKIRSSYQTEDGEWDDVNVFDVKSSSDEEALNGEKYSDW